MIGAALMDQVLDRVAASSGVPDEILLRRLRQDFDSVHFSVCRDDDVPARTPCAAMNDGCRLYYIAASGHCLTLTDDAAAAGGLLVALLDQDEE